MVVSLKSDGEFVSLIVYYDFVNHSGSDMDLIHVSCISGSYPLIVTGLADIIVTLKGILVSLGFEIFSTSRVDSMRRVILLTFSGSILN